MNTSQTVAGERRHGTARKWTLALTSALALNALLLGLALSGFRWVEASPTPNTSVVEATPKVLQVAHPTPAEPAQPATSIPAEPIVATAQEPVQPASNPSQDPVAPTTVDPPLESVQAPPTVESPPTEQVAPPVEPEPSLPADMLIVVNAPRNGGEVYFSLAGKVHCLQPGQYLQLPVVEDLSLEYHPGGDLADNVQQVRAGAFVFRIVDAAWDFQPLETAAAVRLLRSCAAIDPSAP